MATNLIQSEWNDSYMNLCVKCVSLCWRRFRLLWRSCFWHCFVPKSFWDGPTKCTSPPIHSIFGTSFLTKHSQWRPRLQPFLLKENTPKKQKKGRRAHGKLSFLSLSLSCFKRNFVVHIVIDLVFKNYNHLIFIYERLSMLV